MNAKFEMIVYDAGAHFVLHRVNQISADPHWHKEIELVYVLSGRVDAIVEEEPIAVGKGQLLLVNREQVHSINSGQHDEVVDLIVLQISSQMLTSLTSGGGTFYLNTIVDLNTENEEAGSAAKIIRQCMTDIITEVKKMSSETIRNINMLCLHLLSVLIQSFSAQKEEKPRASDNRYRQHIRHIMDYVEKNYAHEISQDEVAAHLGLHPNYLSKVFSSYTNTSFIKYLNTYRIQRVCAELTQTDDSITEIYLRNGFSNGKTFNRVFHSQVGMAPREFRANHLNQLPIQGQRNAYVKTFVATYVNFSDEGEKPGDMPRDFVFEQLPQGEDYSPHGTKQKIQIKYTQRRVKMRVRFNTLVGTGRAYDLMLAPWRVQFEECQRELGFQYVRFHGLLDDEMGIIHQRGGKISYNFFYIDSALEYLLSQGAKPYIELSFMPSALASGSTTVFAYRAGITAPERLEEWEAMIRALIRHLMERFGAHEVCQWYFEVWNEPDIDEFWTGKYEEYLALYRASHQAIKGLDTRIKVGGPAASSVMFQTQEKMHRFLAFCQENELHPDFVSAHPYPAHFYKTSSPFDELQTMCPPVYTVENILWLRGAMRDAGYSRVPLHLNEWNSSPRYNDLVHDTAYMATYVIDTSIRCADLGVFLGWWTVSDLFDEGGVVFGEFGGGFGLFNRSGLKKPAFWGMWALHRLGAEILDKGEDYIVTVRGKTIVALLWNHAFYKPDFAAGDRSGLTYYERYGIFEQVPTKSFSLEISGIPHTEISVTKYQFDQRHGSVYDFWLEHGAVEYLREGHRAILRENDHLKVSTYFTRNQERLRLEAEVKRFGFVLFEVESLR